MKNILVSMDFDGKEEKLIAKAIEMARAFHAKVWLIHVAAPDPDFVGNDVGPQSVRDALADELWNQHKLMDEYTSALKKKDIVAEGLLIQGKTIDTLMEKSKKLKADMIIAGHEEHGFFYKAILGSVSREIIKKSKIPVLIVPLD